MKYPVLIILFLLSYGLNAQETINGSLTHDGLTREYILYVPASYVPGESIPLVLNFHGYTSTAQEQMFYGDFRSIADTAGFLVVHPQGTLLAGQTHWNVGGWTIGSTVDDVGFTAALIDSLSAEYSIDQNRVYSTGMSNGGFMSFLLACQLGERIAAIASVTGSMTPEIFDGCQPDHPTPVLQIHGTNDNVVPYNGAFFTRSIDDVLDYWVTFNMCDPTPAIEDFPDINPNDGSTAEHFFYPSGEKGTVVEHIKVTGGGHTWPGTLFGGAGTNQDLNASLEIWHFFQRFDINGAVISTDVETISNDSPKFIISPNPSNGTFQINSSSQGLIRIFNLSGHLVGSQIVNDNNDSAYTIHIDHPGMYMVQFTSEDGQLGFREKVVVH